MSMTLVASKLVWGSQQISFPVLELGVGGTILDIGSDERRLRHDRTTLTPALFDIHIHGSQGTDVMNASPDEFRTMQRFLAKHGVTQYLPTTVTAPLDFTFRALERMANTIEEPKQSQEAEPAGIHVEGPFLSHSKRGMHPADALQTPSIELFERMQQAARGHIRLVTIAPERNRGPVSLAEGFAPSAALELIRYLSDAGVRCSIGHTNATAEETVAAIAAGAVSATHTFNAMRPLDHREPGVLGVVLDDDGLYADLICDGVHVAGPAIRLWWKAKGQQRAILITDALSATGIGEGDFVVGDTEISVRENRALVAADLGTGKETLAGSVLTLERAVENLREFTGATLAQAVRAASHNPAAMLGLLHNEDIEPGMKVDLVRWDEDGKLLATYMRGEEIRRGS